MLVYVAFKVNQDHIAKNLCVERNVEGSTCKGCCQLKKRLNEQQESKKKLPPVSIEKETINFWKQAFCKIEVYYSEEGKMLAEPLKNYFFLLTSRIFHPPQH